MENISYDFKQLSLTQLGGVSFHHIRLYPDPVIQACPLRIAEAGCRCDCDYDVHNNYYGHAMHKAAACSTALVSCCLFVDGRHIPLSVHRSTLLCALGMRSKYRSKSFSIQEVFR